MTELDMVLTPIGVDLLQMEETSAETSFSGSRYLFRSASEAFRVELTEQEDYDWRALLGGAYLVDHLLDIDKTDIMPHINAVISGRAIPTLHRDTQLSFRNYMLRQDKSRYDDIMQRLDGVSQFAQRQAEAKTADEVVEVRIEEADLLAHLLSLPTEARGDAFAREKFNIWLRGWSRCGYLLDTFIDMKFDYENGDSGVRPSTSSRTTVAAATARESLTAIRNTPLILIGKCAVVGVKYSLLNRKPDMTDLERA
jgi:hypothetical protein